MVSELVLPARAKKAEPRKFGGSVYWLMKFVPREIRPTTE